jgi:hypothetical protein
MPKLVDLTGRRFGKLIALRRSIDISLWFVQCDCGSPEKMVRGSNLSSGNTTSCGCHQRARASASSLIDITGKRFGKLIVISRSEGTKWVVRCDCGSTDRSVEGNNLRRGKTSSCGCNQGLIKHGGHGTPAYVSWQSMIQRCTNKNHKRADRYIDRGICICCGLMEFDDFLRILGPRPANKSIDRWPDKDGNYACGSCSECIQNGWIRNVRWATQGEQLRNTSRTRLLTYNGKTMCLKDWATEVGMLQKTLASRLKKMSVDMALTVPVKR